MNFGLTSFLFCFFVFNSRSVAAKPRSKSRRDDKRRKTSLFRKLSSRKATAEMNQMLSGSQSLNSLRSDMSTGSIGASGASANSPGVITSIRHSTSTPDPQSDSSSPADSAPCSPVTTGNNNVIFSVKFNFTHSQTITTLIFFT